MTSRFNENDIALLGSDGSRFSDRDVPVGSIQTDPYLGLTDANEISKRAKNSFDTSVELEIPLYSAEEFIAVLNGEKPERPNLFIRGIKGLVNKTFVQPVKNILKFSGLGKLDAGLEALREIRRIKEEDGRSVDGKELLRIMESSRKKIEQRVQSAIPELQTPPPEGITEKGVELLTGVGAFVTKLVLARRVVGGTGAASEIAAFEAVNLADNGTPGVGVLLASSLGLIGKVPAATVGGKLAKLGGQGGALASITAAEGGSAEDVAVAFLLPSVLATFNQFPALVKGKRFDIKASKDVQSKLPFMRDVPLKDIRKWSAAMRDAVKVKTGEMTPSRWGRKHGKNLTEFVNKTKQAFDAVTEQVK